MMLACTSGARAEPTPPLTGEMHARFLTLAAARDAVIEGRLAEAGRAVGPLTTTDPGVPFPDAWRPMAARVEQAAKSMAEAPNLQAAAVRVAQVATACAGCHTATGGGPAVVDVEIPAQKWLPNQNMPLHRWAVDWMWLGLLAESDEAWQRGARELDDKPLAMKFDGTAAPELEQLESQVYALATKALTTDGAEARAALMGELLGTCAQCHSKRPAGAKP